MFHKQNDTWTVCLNSIENKCNKKPHYKIGQFTETVHGSNLVFVRVYVSEFRKKHTHEIISLVVTNKVFFCVTVALLFGHRLHQESNKSYESFPHKILIPTYIYQPMCTTPRSFYTALNVSQTPS